tara:strand:+ start:353 stop:952 length:600 start_codon:yes stop_codon:yes gene_type:complete
MSVDLSAAYKVQKNHTENKNIIAYKVGASNHRSANFFGYEGLLLGGLDKSCIHKKNVTKNYDIAEVEIISQILMTDCGDGYHTLGHYIGIECPNVVLPNPSGDPVICIADNCSAGDLLLFQNLDHLDFENVKIYSNSELLCSGVIGNLKYSNAYIVSEAFRIIREFDLPVSSREIFIATGGITDVFPLRAGSLVEIKCE